MGKSFNMKNAILAACGIVGGIVLGKTLLKKGFSTKTIEKISISCLVSGSVLLISVIHYLRKTL